MQVIFDLEQGYAPNPNASQTYLGFRVAYRHCHAWQEWRRIPVALRAIVVTPLNDNNCIARIIMFRPMLRSPIDRQVSRIERC